MKLYWYPGSCSLAPHIALCETGTACELVRTDLFTKKTEHGEDYLALNPKGALPALQLDDGSVITEAAVIMQYIVDRCPASTLLPAAHTLARYRVLEWLNYLASDVHKAFGVLMNPAAPDAFKDTVRAQIGKHFARIAATLGQSPFLGGDTFTLADCYLFTVLGWCAYGGVDLGRWPTLQAYQARIGTLSAVQQALREEGLA